MVVSGFSFCFHLFYKWNNFDLHWEDRFEDRIKYEIFQFNVETVKYCQSIKCNNTHFIRECKFNANYRAKCNCWNIKLAMLICQWPNKQRWIYIPFQCKRQNFNEFGMKKNSSKSSVSAVIQITSLTWLGSRT